MRDFTDDKYIWNMFLLGEWEEKGRALYPGHVLAGPGGELVVIVKERDGEVSLFDVRTGEGVGDALCQHGERRAEKKAEDRVKENAELMEAIKAAFGETYTDWKVVGFATSPRTWWRLIRLMAQTPETA